MTLDGARKARDDIVQPAVRVGSEDIEKMVARLGPNDGGPWLGGDSRSGFRYADGYVLEAEAQDRPHGVRRHGCGGDRREDANPAPVILRGTSAGSRGLVRHP